MALTREKKEAVVTEIEDLLSKSKMTVFAAYQGTPVKFMQELRASAKDGGTVVKIIKNRLFKRSLQSHDNLKNVDSGNLKGQLLYAFSETDEAAPAQVLAAFARNNPQVQFMGAISADGQLLSAEEVNDLASLPNRNQLQAQLAAQIGSPVSSLINVMAANVRGVLNVLSARANNLSS